MVGKQPGKFRQPDSPRFWLWNLLFALAAFFWIQGMLGHFQPQRASYSQFLEAVNSERVVEVAIGAKRIVWKETADGAAAGALYETDRIPNIDESSMLEKLQAAKVEFVGIPPDEFWPSLVSVVLPVALLAAFWYWMYSRSGGMNALNLGRSQPRIWDESTDKITFKEVAGVDEAVHELREIVAFLKDRDRYGKLGARIPKGVLLSGPPGTGKTLLAKATAGEAGVPFFSLSGADFVEMFVGVGAARVRDLFRKAREKAPCIVFIDEIDTIGRSRGNARSVVSNDEREQTLNQLLVEMDGFDSREGVILMAATNRPDVLDRALVRPGRFDRQIVVDAPDLNGREAILKVHARKSRLAAEVDLRLVAARTPGFCGADLANVINDAALFAIRRGREEIRTEDIDEAIDRAIAGLERKSRILNAREREIVAHHEMGHALAGAVLEHADPVHKVTIIPRGSAALGATIQAPLEDRYLLGEEELLDRLTVLLAGRAAEIARFGGTTSGAADDLRRATELAKRMVCQFGMNEALGPVALDEESSNQEPMPWHPRGHSEATARRIDAEVKGLLEKAAGRALEIVRGHEDAFLEMSRRLLEREVIEGGPLLEELERLGVPVRRKRPVPPASAPPRMESAAAAAG